LGLGLGLGLVGWLLLDNYLPVDTSHVSPGVDGASRATSAISQPVMNDSSADLKGAHTDRSSSSQGLGHKNTKPAEEEELPRAPSPLAIDRPITSRGPGKSHVVKEEDPAVAAAAAEVVPRKRRKDDFFDQSVKSPTYNVQLDPQSSSRVKELLLVR
jgi:hypothetical protein